jgi:hypothetical protein
MKKNLGTYTIHREKNNFVCSVACHYFPTETVIIFAKSANEQAEKINKAIRIFEEKLVLKIN